jgi:hypothetical protein
LFFAGASRERGSQRLRQLFDGRFLQVRMGKLSDPNVYSLGEAGRRWAQDHGIPVGRAPSGDTAHHLAVVELWSRLAAALGQRDGPCLGYFRADWEIRERDGERLPVIPDALIEITGRGEGRGLARVALEADLGNERLETIREKLLGYAQLRSLSAALLGWCDFSLVVVMLKGGSRREQAFTELLRSYWPGAFVLLRSQEWPGLFLEKLADATLPTDPSNGKKGDAGGTSTTPTDDPQEDPGPSR